MDSMMVFSTMLFVLCAVASGQEKITQKKFTAEGTTISYGQKLYTPPYVFKKNDAMLNQTSVLNCSHLYFSKLAAGDIDGAASLSNDPQKVKTKFARYVERVGMEEFKGMFAGYFSGTAEARAELTVGSHAMLIIYDSGNEMFTGQMYAKEKSQFVVADKEHSDVDQLGKLLNALQEGTLKVQ